jgi:hypothetical protein
VPGLSLAHQQLVAGPVEVGELQRPHIGAAQPEPGDQQDDRVIPLPARIVPVLAERRPSSPDDCARWLPLRPPNLAPVSAEGAFSGFVSDCRRSAIWERPSCVIVGRLGTGSSSLFCFALRAASG